MTESKLNPDQKRAITTIGAYLRNPDMRPIVVNGRAGTGKSFMTDALIRRYALEPLLLAPTHSALKTLKNSIHGDFESRTVASSLGIRPIDTQKNIKFKLQGALPSFWNDVPVAILDEGSMIGQLELDALVSTQTKLIILGHENQLPSVDDERGSMSPCIPAVFNQGYQTINLTIQQRGLGELEVFNNLIEEQVPKGGKDIPKTFDILGKDLKKFMNSEEAKESLHAGDLVLLGYKNRTVHGLNQHTRRILFPETYHTKYVETDSVMLTSPLTYLADMGKMYGEKEIMVQAKVKDVPNIYSNTLFKVLNVSQQTFRFSGGVELPCYKLEVENDDGIFTIFEPLHVEELDKILLAYEHRAWTVTDLRAREKVYQDKHLLSSCFAKLQHGYAMTSHRAQGRTIPHVITFGYDMFTCVNKYEAIRLVYVACSRASESIRYYRLYI